MRITSLQLEDYKCFSNLVLENLGNRIVLVGPNGCGKSAVLEAVAVLKEYVGSYDPSEQAYHRQLPGKHARAWPENVPLPIRGDRPTATVTAEVSLDSAEIEMAGGVDKARVGIRID
jgi:ATPase subunit of ABC transporter with duplicated ATPase domains